MEGNKTLFCVHGCGGVCTLLFIPQLHIHGKSATKNWGGRGLIFSLVKIANLLELLMWSLRYTEWVKFGGAPDYKPDWRAVYGVELYNHVKDPGENRNEANNPEYRTAVLELRKLLHAGWRHVPFQEMEYDSLTTHKWKGVPSQK